MNKEIDVRTINVVALAYLGDAIYEVYIRERLILMGISHALELQKRAVLYVSAKGQASILNRLLEKGKFITVLHKNVIEYCYCNFVSKKV